MIADDHAVFRNCVIQALEEIEGLTVVACAADGQEAVDLTVRLHPDLVIMDVNMPRMNGIEATREISRSLPDVRVIGLSMHPENEFIGEQMRAAGAICHFPKDGPPEILLDAIRFQLSLASPKG